MIQRQGIAGEDTLIVALNFDCNSRCTFCIIETEISRRLPPTDVAVFESVFDWNQRERAFKRLTISGAEATLRADLPQLAESALSQGGFEVVRIQTNARKLADRALCERLIAAGITEFFVSVHAHDRELTTKITRAPRGFDEMRQGIEHLIQLGARVISNTVICAENLHAVPDIAQFVVSLGIREVELWNFLEIGDAGQKDSLVHPARAVPAVRDAIALLGRENVEPVVKWFPRCLLEEHGRLLDNRQPQMLIRDSFQDRLSHNFGFSCAHAQNCHWFGRGCDGIHERHLEVFGNVAEQLRPQGLPQ